MPVDVFKLRDRVVEEYKDYFRSFINIDDPEIASFVECQLNEGRLWPEAVLQLNPAFEKGETLEQLAARGLITPETARFFGPKLHLHLHQQEAIERAATRKPYVVSTGTGSGKSLTYLLPIVDEVFRNEPSRHSVRAIVIYPMNPLINSQLYALERFRRENWPDCPVRFASYTGETRDADREAIIQDPPHVLLTNYVMLEYMLIRPRERTLVQQATRELRFLVLDELHVYRGRQGSDIGMLMRRVRQRAGLSSVQFVGTSATLATEGSRDQRRASIAEVAGRLFGEPVSPDNVVDETLRRRALAAVPRTPGELRAAVEASPPAANLNAIALHPLAAWVEENFGLAEEDGRLVRHPPETYAAGLKRLVDATGVDSETCHRKLKDTLEAGNQALTETGDPAFAFRLHQFLASGGSVFATLEAPGTRLLTAEGQYAIGGDSSMERLLFPLAFCRECGQEYYLAALRDEEGHSVLRPRQPLLNEVEDESTGELGFFAPERDSLWGGDRDDLPEFWFQQRKAGPVLKSNYAPFEPRHCSVTPDGAITNSGASNGSFQHPAGTAQHSLAGWFQRKPFMFCPRCRAAFDLREKSDFGKLATLSQTGRSTATTLLSGASVIEMEDQGVEPAARKLLSFTDNRQDASLQAGHLNDFVQVALVRTGLVSALERSGEITLDQVGRLIFESLALPPERFMKEPTAGGPGYESARQAMIALLEYRALEDLRRAWRVAQPNLEQCGLLAVRYSGLDQLARDEALWKGAPAIADAAAPDRERVLSAVLGHLRSVLAIDAGSLTGDGLAELRKRANYWLADPWAIDERGRLRQASVALLPDEALPAREETITLSLGWRSAIGRYLRSPRTWGIDQPLSTGELDELVGRIVAGLRGHLLGMVRRDGHEVGVQLLAGALRWTAGDGKAAPPDPVRSRELHRRLRQMTEPNHYFVQLYREKASALSGVVGREHTGQTKGDVRADRERDFRDGKLAALFCSPTMELGVDIADLYLVHMRNVPPTPANYAQRSGRAGRGGRAALVLAFCSQGSAHDQYFFRNRDQMISGAVAPARMDLANKELVEAHLHSVWLSAVGVSLQNSMDHFLNLDSPGYPIVDEFAAQLQLSSERQRQIVEAFTGVVATDPDISKADWFNEGWLAQTVAEAPAAFDAALSRWRELYESAEQARDAARKEIDRRGLKASEKDAAERRERESKRERDVLLNQGERLESDFYPYRYFASEGFLPGYNFPRLPLRAWVAGRDEHGKETADSIDRPRFLALSEFGPWNIIYHEGRKHRVSACILPAGDVDARITRAQLCKACGYVHPRDAVDMCEHCGTLLDADSSDFPQALLDQPAVRTRRSERISADEEERSREGYQITTHYRFADGSRPKQAQVIGNDGTELLELACAPRAALWKINHGWRRARERNGFTIDRDTGQWRPLDADSSDGLPSDLLDRAPMAGVKPYVYDTRNILLLRPVGEEAHSDLFLYSLAVALQRGIQFVYQVEEPEIQLELIGSGAQRRLLLWEAAEGGAGIWGRLVSTSGGFSEVAAKALEVIHFDPSTGTPNLDWADRCARACYDCLLSYTNQRNHPLLDRHAISDYLFRLASASTATLVGERDREEQYEWLVARTDPASNFEREFLRFLYESGLRLPDLAQHTPSPDVYAQPDFYYERDGLPGTCVFVDGPSHDGPRVAEVDHTAREALEDRGFRVISIRFDEPLEAQVARYVEIFGRASQSTSQAQNEVRRAQLQERFRMLVDRKYLDTLTQAEEEEMHRLETEIGSMDAAFYRPIIERLRSELPDRRADQT